MKLAPRVLHACRSCARHVFADEPACPFCGAAEASGTAGRTLRAGGVAALLVAAACGGVTETPPSGAGGMAAHTGGAQAGGSLQTGGAQTGGATTPLLDGGPVDATVADAGPRDSQAGNPCPPYGEQVGDVCMIPIYRSPPPLPCA